jgi:hypothetical protein
MLVSAKLAAAAWTCWDWPMLMAFFVTALLILHQLCTVCTAPYDDTIYDRIRRASCTRFEMSTKFHVQLTWSYTWTINQRAIEHDCHRTVEMAALKGV